MVENPGRLDQLCMMIREQRVLTALIGVYLLLSAIELVRVVQYDRPRAYDVGFFQPERLTLPEGAREFHWTHGDTGHIVRPPGGAVMRIPIYFSHPQLPESGVTLRFYADETLFDVQNLTRNGRYRFDYYLPPILGADPWRQDPQLMSLKDTAELKPVVGDEPFMSVRWRLPREPDYARVLTGWRMPPGPPPQRFRIETSETFVPMDYAAQSISETRQQRRSLDQRVLGVGVGEILWLRQLPPEGLGFYSTETNAGRRFRWSTDRASWPIAAAPLGSDTLLFRARIASPDASARPVAVTLYWNADAVGSESFNNGSWRQMRLESLPHTTEPGVLTVVVSRTWNARRAGVGADSRNLGIAVSEPYWE